MNGQETNASDSGDRREASLPAGPSDGRQTRKGFVVGAGSVGLGLILATPGTARTVRRRATPGLAPGKVGGPTGFPGAARYQYEANSSEGRAMLALRRLVKDGRVKTITIQLSPGAKGHWVTPYPTKSAPTPAQVLERETGLKLKFVEVQNTELYRKGIQESQLRSGKWQIGEVFYTMKGDLAEAGLLRNLASFVQKHKPDWADPKYGYVGGQTTANLFNYYKGDPYIVAFDGDYMPWFYRSDLFADPKNGADFEDQYGQPLVFPRLWSDHAKVAKFFTRSNGPLYGSVDMKNVGWGYPTWQARYASFGIPNKYYFGLDGGALINSDAGVQALEEHIASLAWTYPGALSKSWPEMYGAMGDGTGVMAAAFANMTKFITAGNPLDKGFGKVLRSEVPPGRIVNGKLVRRAGLFGNTSYGVNRFADPKLHEAAYLVLQWAGSARVFAWMVGNPAGYYDPNRNFLLDDPVIAASYKPHAVKKLKQVIPHAVPDITIRGAQQYIQALDLNIQKAMSKQISAQQAMKNTADAWDKITERLGTAKQSAAIKADRAAWPTVVEPA